MTKFEQRDGQVSIYDDPRFLISNGYQLIVMDRAHKNFRNQAFVDTSVYAVPETMQIDRYSYLAGSNFFRLSEIEVYSLSL